MNYRNESKWEDMNLLQQEYEKYQKKLTIFLYLKVGDKIGKTNEKYTLYREGYSQNWARWWYGENRKRTLHYINLDFTKFVKYLDIVLDMHSVSSLPKYKYLVGNTVDSINDIIPGLYNLKKTYHDDAKLICKIDSIILILIDFKGKMKSKNDPKVHKQSRTCF